MTKQRYFTNGEIILYASSVFFILLSFIIFDRSNYLSLISSLIGATSLILCAKGNPLGQILIIVFSVVYGIISFSCAYYGEIITYLGMSAPMAVVALVSWLKNPYNGNRSQVKVKTISKTEWLIALILTAIVTALFYFILKALSTAQLAVSTLSVTTSFLASYLVGRRSPFYALAYAANDIVLIVLWVLAAVENISYLSVIICFITFLINDLYGFISWIKMQKAQSV